MEINFGAILDRFDERQERKKGFHYYFAWCPTLVYDRKLIWLKWYAAYKQVGGCGAYGNGCCWHKYDLSLVAESEDGTIYLCSDINKV